MSERPLLIHRIIARLNVGGPAMHVVNLAGALGGGRWRTRLVSGVVESTEGDMGYYAEERSVEVTYLPAMARSIDPLSDLRTLLRLVRLFRAERPDVVHTHTAKAGTVGRLAALIAGVPTIVHTYHGHVLGGSYFAPWKTRLFLEIERQLARFTDRLVVLTEGQAKEMADELGIAPRDRFAVVPLGLDLSRFLEVDRHARSAAAHEAIDVPDPDALVVGIVGRMVPVKNHELFLEVVRSLSAAAGRPVHAVVVGAGEREEELRAHAAELGLGDRVHWLGWRSDLEAIYPAIDVLLLTSHDEGTPVALLEALVAGTPVVARDVGGVAEMLAGAGAGRVVPRSADPAAWVEAVLAAVGDDPADRAAIAAHYSIERLADDLAALYVEEITSRTGMGQT